MPGSTSNLGLTLPLGADSPSALRVGITNNANALDAYSLLTSVASNVGSGNVLRGQSVIALPTTTQTLPAPSVNAMVAITAASTVTVANPVTIAGSNIYGVGLSAVSSFTLRTAGACAVLQSDGTSWFVVGGRQDTLAVSRGATNIATSESRTNVAFGTLPTPDQVTGIVLPPNGKLRVSYQAIWQNSVGGAGQAAIFLNGNQLQVQGWDAVTGHQPLPEAATLAPTGLNTPLFSFFGGLASGTSSSAFTADVTTGQAVGFLNIGGGNFGVQVGANSAFVDYSSSGPAGASTGAAGGVCEIFAAAGTYTVSVQFKSSSGSVTASNRKLWVEAVSFG